MEDTARRQNGAAASDPVVQVFANAVVEAVVSYAAIERLRTPCGRTRRASRARRPLIRERRPAAHPGPRRLSPGRRREANDNLQIIGCAPTGCNRSARLVRGVTWSWLKAR